MKAVFLLAALSATLSSHLYADTVFTGDRIEGVPVITELDLSDLTYGHHRFMFRGAEMATGQYWYTPVMVAKGKEKGKNVLVQSGVHGDELNGVRVVQELFSELSPENIKGSVIGVVGANRSGIEHVSRYWQISTDGGYGVDFNRVHPGKEHGNAAERQAWLLWEGLYKNNVDLALDYHTQFTGTAYPLFIYADYSLDDVKVMAELFPADQIKKDPGQKGTVETTFISKGIPALTVELGKPRIFESDMIARTLEGTKNVLVHYGVIRGDIVNTAKTAKTYIGNSMYSIRAKVGGFAEVLVDIGQDVEEGQLVAVQRNAFGDIIQEYKASSKGKVLAVGTDATREPRSLLVRVLTQELSEECQNGC